MKRKALLILCIAALVALCTSVVFAENIIIIGIDETTSQSANNDGEQHAPAGMYIGPKNVGGMTKEQVANVIEGLVEELKTKSIEITSKNGSMDIALADMDIVCTNKDTLITSVMGEHGFGNFIQQYKQEKDLEKNGMYLTPEYSVNASGLVNYLLTQNPDLETSPASASIVKDENGKFVVSPSTPGFTVDYDATYEAVVKAIENYDGYELSSVEIIGNETEAASDESIYEGFGALLGSSTTSYDCTGNERTENRATNIRVASSRINGTVLLPGQEFSFCNAVQPFSEEGGYRKAGTIMDGQTVDDLGGGVCQVSTTLYGAVLYSELEVTFRRPHSKVSSYIDPGLDAMVYVRNGQDFKFVNSTTHVIYIEAYTTPNYEGDPSKESVTFNIYGTEYRPAERTIWYEGVTVSKEWLEGELGCYNVITDESLVAAGNKEGRTDHMMEVRQYPSPQVSAKAIKHVYVNGVEASAEEVPNSRTTYRGAVGTLVFHPNSYVRKIKFDPDTQVVTYIELVTRAEGNKPSKSETSSETKPSSEETSINPEPSSSETQPTEPPATDPPATEPPATEPPATEPVTEPPVTEPPVTEPPVTEPITDPVDATVDSMAS